MTEQKIKIKLVKSDRRKLASGQNSSRSRAANASGSWYTATPQILGMVSKMQAGLK